MRWIEKQSGTTVVLSVIQGNKKEEIQVRVTDSGKEDLTQDEKIVYDWIVEVAHSKVEKEFTMKEFEKYCIKNNTKFSKMIENNELFEYAQFCGNFMEVFRESETDISVTVNKQTFFLLLSDILKRHSFVFVSDCSDKC